MNIRTTLIVAAISLLSFTTSLHAQSEAQASDNAYRMAAKYSGTGWYMTPSKEGFAGFATTLEFELPVSQGLDYLFILGGDKYCLGVNVWITSEVGNTIVKDTRTYDNGLCGVRWRSDYSGTVKVTVHFTRVTSRCAWAALVGRRSTSFANAPVDSPTVPGAPTNIGRVSDVPSPVNNK